MLQRVEDGQDAQMAKEALTEATEAETMLKAQKTDAIRVTFQLYRFTRELL